jgi:hypothetical protein
VALERVAYERLGPPTGHYAFWDPESSGLGSSMFTIIEIDPEPLSVRTGGGEITAPGDPAEPLLVRVGPSPLGRSAAGLGARAGRRRGGLASCRRRRREARTSRRARPRPAGLSTGFVPCHGGLPATPRGDPPSGLATAERPDIPCVRRHGEPLGPACLRRAWCRAGGLASCLHRLGRQTSREGGGRAGCARLGLETGPPGAALAAPWTGYSTSCSVFTPLDVVPAVIVKLLPFSFTRSATMLPASVMFADPETSAVPLGA